MSNRMIQGPLSDIDREDGFDEDGYPIQLSKARIGTTEFGFTSRRGDYFMPDAGDFLIVELDASGKKAIRCYSPYHHKGTGKGWKKLARTPAALEHRYRVLQGQVKHKEINHVRADMARENSWPSHYYRVVLTNGQDFLLDEKLGGHVRSGDQVQVLWHGEQGLIAYRNLTRPKRSGPKWTDWLIVAVFGIPLLWMFFHFLALLGEPDGGKIFMLVMFALLPVGWVWFLIARHVESRRCLALLDERIRRG